MSSFGSIVKQMRAAYGLTQPELAEILSKLSGQEITRSAVSMWELGKRTPKMDIISILADYFDVSVDVLLGRRLLDADPQESAMDQMPEITMIARAGKKMTTERRSDMLKLLKIAFPEEFND